eukprot:COSAG01_NODE_70103_length_259_cov_1.125000_1_plen_74_part_10
MLVSILAAVPCVGNVQRPRIVLIVAESQAAQLCRHAASAASCRREHGLFRSHSESIKSTARTPLGVAHVPSTSL